MCHSWVQIVGLLAYGCILHVVRLPGKGPVELATLPGQREGLGGGSARVIFQRFPLFFQPVTFNNKT